MSKHLSILFPQWQGGGISATYEGAISLKKHYLQDSVYMEIPVEDPADSPALEVKNKIVGYDAIIRQLSTLKEKISEEDPDTLFVMGGGDDVDILPPAFCNHKYNGDITLVFFDAHGDLNSPETSPSGNLHGMPLRALLGDTDKSIAGLMDSFIKPDQVVMVGTRDCDPPEKEYILEHNIVSLSPSAVNGRPEILLEELAKKGSHNVFIHVDIDVIDPSEFKYQPVPAPEGLTERVFLSMLDGIKNNYNIVGMCILGYTEMPDGTDPVLKELVHFGLSL